MFFDEKKILFGFILSQLNVSIPLFDIELDFIVNEVLLFISRFDIIKSPSLFKYK